MLQRRSSVFSKCSVFFNFVFNIHIKPTRFTGNADSIRSSDKLHGLFVDPHQSDGVDGRQNLTIEATCANLDENINKIKANVKQK